MVETPETAREIQEIRFELETIRSTQLLLLRDRVDSLRAQLLELFAGDDQLKRVYLALDGKRTQKQLKSAIEDDGYPISEATISRRLDKLREHGLVEEVASSETGKVYERNPLVEEILRLSRDLERLA
jgi:DNA-binding HxlR family transcriptional regulator